jgi:26S proteasome regulatory subunit N7
MRDLQLKRAHYLTRIGDKEAALSALRRVYDSTTLSGVRFEILFELVRIGFFFCDSELTSTSIERAQKLLEEGGDWECRNRLKVYRALYYLTIRDWAKAAPLLLESTSTFACTELLTLRSLVTYTVLAAVLCFKRPQLHDKVVRSSEVTEVLYALPQVRDYLHAFYDCNYAQFFRTLAEMEWLVRRDRYVSSHASHYVREMRIAAYSQMLESYSTLRLDTMSAAFGVSPEFLEKELARLIASGRITCRIDQVGGVLVTTRADQKNRLYQSLVRQGDLLLNRLQKLSRVINI